MKHDLEFIVKTIKDRGLTAYKIAEETGLTEVGINKILNGKSKTPRQSTLEILRNYLFDSEDDLHNNYVNEPQIQYNKSKKNDSSGVVLKDFEEEIETFTNKNGVKFYVYPDGSTKIEVIKIPFNAYATFLEAYADEEKLHSEFSTTIFTVDKVAKGNYFAFDIKNNSMNGGGIYDTPSGAEVLCREIGRHLWLSLHRNDYGFILMTKKAIYHKDIKSYNPENGMFVLSSRDKENHDFEININDVFRIFNVIKRTF